MRPTGCGTTSACRNPLWGEACLTMGRELAAVALAIVSTKEPEHFRSIAGRLFPRHGRQGQGRRAAPRAHRLGPAPGIDAGSSRRRGRARPFAANPAMTFPIADRRRCLRSTVTADPRRYSAKWRPIQIRAAGRKHNKSGPPSCPLRNCGELFSDLLLSDCLATPFDEAGGMASIKGDE